MICLLVAVLKIFMSFCKKVDNPKRLYFCVDTAHAYSFGYELTSPEKMDAFIGELHTTISLEKIELIHLNDTSSNLGSNQDRHALPGEGKIGEEMLKRFVLDPRLIKIPIIIEPPLIAFEQQQQLLARIHSWYDAR